MQVKVMSEKDNPVMQRKELTVELDFEGGATPKKQDVITALAKAKGCGEELVEVTRVDTSSGRTSGKANAKIWHSKETREKFTLHKRKKAVKKEGAEAEAAPAKK